MARRGLTLSLLSGLVLLSYQADAEETTRSWHRPRIEGGNDCAFVAHDGPAQPADICAKTLLSLSRVFRQSSFAASTCEVALAVDEVVWGGAWGAGLVFLPLGEGRFLIGVRCFAAAYNEQWIFFAYDEFQRWQDDLAGRREMPLKVLMFPMFSRVGAKPIFTCMSFYRDYSPKNSTLHGFLKASGDGSAGVYSEHVIDRRHFMPSLKKYIYKREPDGKDIYQFKLEEQPSGHNWQNFDIETTKSGYLLEASAALTKKHCFFD